MKETNINLNTTRSSFSGRILAGLIDYFFLLSSTSLIENAYPAGDLSFLIFLTLATIYYTVANSIVLGGQTIGKKLFGLRTVAIKQNEKGPDFLSLNQSFLRFVVFLGLVIALKEIPPIIYREFLIEGPRTLLDLPLLASLALFFGNITTTLFHSHQRGLHDIISGSVVIRHPEKETLASVDRSSFSLSYYNPLIGTAIGSCLAALLWTMSVIQPHQLKILTEKQFVLEKHLNIKILHAASNENTISMVVIPDSTDELSFTQCSKLAQNLLEPLTLRAAEIKVIELTCLSKLQQNEKFKLTLNVASGEILPIEETPNESATDASTNL